MSKHLEEGGELLTFVAVAASTECICRTPIEFGVPRLIDDITVTMAVKASLLLSLLGLFPIEPACDHFCFP